mmetsp:Transcript_866/g.1724  ORF Transcript_866/g.1724 Transcript_866/m.1724 type:complete len:226 (+) Transcript_866:140-817(+)
MLLQLLGHPNGFQVCILFEPSPSMFSSDPAHLRPSKRWRLAGEVPCDVRIHPCDPGLQPRRDFRAFLGIRRPHGAAQAEGRCISAGHSVIDVSKGDHGQHRAELLLVDQAHPLLDTSDERRREEIPWPFRSRAPAKHLRSLFFRVLKEPCDDVVLHLVVQRAMGNAFRESISNACVLRVSNQGVHKRIEDLLVYIEPLDSRADLACVRHACLEDLATRWFDVYIV